MMTIKEWLTQAKEYIDGLDAELIALEVFAPRGSDRSWLVLHEAESIEPKRKDLADRSVKSRERGVPLAYVLGYKEFYGREFLVTSAVLIPRPETEVLIDLIKGLGLPNRPKFLEIGTGSGCIAVTLALEFPQATIVATDVSRKALGLAQQNNIQLEGRVKLVQADLLKGLEGQFDVIVANLPYVSEEWTWIDRESLSFEPKNAIYAKAQNGTSLYRKFFVALSDSKTKVTTRYVVIEADPCQHEELTKVARENYFDLVKIEGFGMVFESQYWDAR